MKEYIDYLFSDGPKGIFRLEGETGEEFIKRCDDIEKTLFADVIAEVEESEEYKSYLKYHNKMLERIRSERAEQGSFDTAD